MNIIKKISLVLGLSGILVGAAGAVAVVDTTPVAACTGAQCAKDGANNVQTGGSKTTSVKQVVQTVTNILLFIIGVVAVIMIVIGGLKYTASNGDSNQIQAAKNTILYAVIGIIVAIIAYAVVQFVVDAFV